MSTADTVDTTDPPARRLVPLRTKEEVRASLEKTVVYVVEVPAREANAVKELVQAAIPDFKTPEINHLRRVVQYKYLPAHLQNDFYPPMKIPRGDEENPEPTDPISLSPSTPSFGNDVTEHFDLVRYFLLCPTRYIQHADLFDLLRGNPPLNSLKTPPRIFYITVPALAPTSAEQANQWSNTYWPIAFKNTNPYGPHPTLVERNANEIADNALKWVDLANTAASQISQLQLGEPLGCVVVDQSKGTPEIVAVAGDCRWRSPTGQVEERCGTGNTMAHAIHRAIAMVAKKRLRSGGTDPTLLDRPLFCDSPLTEVEQKYYDMDNADATGYLCVDLDIYITHEPCVMCSMAILHSRFRRCVFGQRMPLTGGMTADKVGGANVPGGGLQHGIFWRPSELNWKFLAWETQGGEQESKESVKDTVHV